MRRRSFLGGLVAALASGRLPTREIKSAAGTPLPTWGIAAYEGGPDPVKLPDPSLAEDLYGEGWQDGEDYWVIWRTPDGLTMTHNAGRGADGSPVTRRIYRSVVGGWELVAEETFTYPESEAGKMRYIESCWRAGHSA